MFAYIKGVYSACAELVVDLFSLNFLIFFVDGLFFVSTVLVCVMWLFRMCHDSFICVT